MRTIIASCLCLMLSGLALAGGAPAASALTPRPPANKSDAAALAADTPIERVVLKFHEGTRVRLRGGALVVLPRLERDTARLATLGLSAATVESDLQALAAVLASSSLPQGLGRLFSAEEQVLADFRATGEEQSGTELADLDLFFSIGVAAGTTAVEAEALIDALNDLASVELAYADPVAVAAVDIPPTTPNFEGGQGYLDAAPGGVDARYAWTLPGGRGAGVNIVDVERAWNTTHEDLPPLFHQGGTQTTDPDADDWRRHGTAVLGEMVAPNNGYGVTGIAHQAQAGYESSFHVSTGDAIARAALAAGSGNLVLIELQNFGPPTPSSPCGCAGGCCDCVPVEYLQAEFDAIKTATANGVIVVEAGANGATNLDDPIYGGRFNRAVRDSGAVLVGASGALDRAPTCFTNYGSRIDVHSWGTNITTTGYGDLFNGGGDPNQQYTAAFGGTSGASPIVTASAGVLQGISRAAGKPDVTPLAMRQLLRDTGTPQAPGPQQIGPQPNLRAAADILLSDGAQFVAQEVPASMVAGEWYPVSLTVKNLGASAWSVIGPQCNAFRIGSWNPQDNSTWSVGRVDLTAPVAAGGTQTITFQVRAPASPGTYNFQWRMVQECVAWFGTPSANMAVTVTAPEPRDARFLAQSVPPVMVAGQSYGVSLRVRNSGTLTWSPIGPVCNAFRLGATNPQDNSTWGAARVDLAAPVAPGGEVTLNFTVTAPATPGTYNFQWRMVHECLTWFGELSPNVAVVVRAGAAKDAQILAQTAPASIAAGQGFSASVRVKNVGSTTWSPIGPQCNAFRLGATNPQDNSTWGIGRVDLPAALAPGAEVTLTFSATAPAIPGTYNFQWRMVHECVEWFGDPGPAQAVIVTP